MEYSNIEDLVKELAPVTGEPAKVYSAVVSRIDQDGRVWVHVAGSDIETPTATTSAEVSPNDAVNVEWRNNKLYIAGNVTNPAAGSTRVNAVEQAAQIANQAAQNAVSDAGVARQAAESAQHAVAEIEDDVTGLNARLTTAEGNITTIEGNITSLGTRVTTAEGNITTIEGNVTSLGNRVTTAEGKVATAEGKVATLEGEVDALDTNVSNLSGRVATAESDITAVEGDITTLQGRVDDAEETVDGTLRELSVAQDVIGTVNWIANHGTMTNQTGHQFDENQVYFIVDANGDYNVGGTRYSVVSEPVASDINNYYLLSISDSVQNYVATHVVVDSEGLWIIPDAGGNKVLIATGNGSTYTTAGTYIIRGADALAQFTADGAVIGKTGETRAEVDYHSFKLVDIEGREYFSVSDLRNAQGVATITQEYTEIPYDTGVTYALEYSATDTDYEVTFNGGALYEGWVLTKDYDEFSIMPTGAAPPTDPDYRIKVTYTTSDADAKAYTLGTRKSTFPVGSYSFAEGVDVAATEYCSHAEGEETISRAQNSHAEGYRTIASALNSHAEGAYTTSSGQEAHAEGDHTKAAGFYSHAEGINTVANGEASHAQNIGTKASSDNQTVLGKYNIEDTNDAYAVIIGNGSDDNNRSNALTVDWEGDVQASGFIRDGFGNTLSSKADASSLAPVATSGNYDDLSNKPTIPVVPTNVSAFTNDAGYITGYTETDPTVPSWAKAPSKPSYSASEISGLLDFFYPVGSYYETSKSQSDFDPNVAWGGTWVLDSQGRVTVSQDTTDTAFDVLGETGGEKTHTLKISEMPAHNHDITFYYRNTVAYNSGSAARPYSKSGSLSTQNWADSSTEGGGQAHNNLQPYIVVNRWHRTA